MGNRQRRFILSSNGVLMVLRQPLRLFWAVFGQGVVFAILPLCLLPEVFVAICSQCMRCMIELWSPTQLPRDLCFGVDLAIT